MIECVQSGASAKKKERVREGKRRKKKERDYPSNGVTSITLNELVDQILGGEKRTGSALKLRFGF